MATNASAYDVLGVEPGADWTTVERAYKTLMKTHHPDRAGGDAERAAEINRAYRELRQARASYPWLEPVPMFKEPKRSRLRLAVILGVVAFLVLVALLPASARGGIGGFLRC